MREEEPGEALDRSYLMADYRQATAGLNIVKTVYMEVDVDPAQQVQEGAHALGEAGAGQQVVKGEGQAARVAIGAIRAHLGKGSRLAEVRIRSRNRCAS